MIPQTKPWDVQNRIETNEQELNGVNEVLDLRLQGTIEKGAKKTRRTLQNNDYFANTINFRKEMFS